MNTLVVWLGRLFTLGAAFGLLARYVSPEVFWPPAVVTLLLPFLLLLTILHLTFLLLKRRWRLSVLPLTVVAFAIPVMGKLFSLPGSVGSPLNDDAPTFTVVTGNQRMFRSADGVPVDTARVYEAVKNYGADALLLQEVLPTRYPQDNTHQVKMAGGYTRRQQLDRTTIATYGTRLEEIEYFFTPPNEYNGYLVSDVETPLGKLRIVNAHLESNNISGMSDRISREGGSAATYLETFVRMLKGYGTTSRKRAGQAARIRKVVEQSPYPVILAGDFNDVPSSYTYRQLLTPRLRDAWTERGTGLGETFTGTLPGLRIDYVLVDTSLSVREIKRLPSNWSDHRPLRVVVSE